MPQIIGSGIVATYSTCRRTGTGQSLVPFGKHSAANHPAGVRRGSSICKRKGAVTPPVCQFRKGNGPRQRHQRKQSCQGSRPVRRPFDTTMLLGPPIQQAKPLDRSCFEPRSSWDRLDPKTDSQFFPYGIAQVDEVNVFSRFVDGLWSTGAPEIGKFTPRGFSIIRFVEDILVLCIAQRQSPLAGLFSDDELKAAVRGIYRNH